MAVGDLTGLGQILEVRLYGNLYAQVCINTFHYRVSAVSGPGVPVSAFGPLLEDNIWDDGGGNGLRTMISNSVTAVAMSFQNIAPIRYVPFNWIPANTGGGVASVSLPPTTTVVVRRKSLRSGRKYRGRIFVPGLPSTFTTGGEVNATGRGIIPSAISNLINPLTVSAGGGTVTITPVIYSGRAPANMQDVAVWEYDEVLRVQRRREVGRGI